MEQSIRTCLESAFPPDIIRTRKGPFGQELRYVETCHYVRRLNEAFQGDWTFRVLQHQVLDDEVVVLGELSANVTKVAFGGSSITRTREDGKPVSIADDLKAAASDSLKKCCSLLGMGLHLYSNSNPEPVTKAGQDEPAERKNNRLTERQYQTVLSVAAGKGITEPELKTRVLDAYGLPLDRLDRRQASELITHLSGRNGGAS